MTARRADASQQGSLEKYLGRERDPDGALVPRKKKTRAVAASAHGRTIAEASTMMRTRKWDGCAARHLVALYDLMHERTYGVASEMSPTERYRSTMLMGAFVKRSFAGDFVEAVAYFRWVWTREIGREKWRRENNVTDGRRIGFALMMSGSMVTDYRLALHRQGQGAPSRGPRQRGRADAL